MSCEHNTLHDVRNNFMAMETRRAVEQQWTGSGRLCLLFPAGFLSASFPTAAGLPAMTSTKKRWKLLVRCVWYLYYNGFEAHHRRPFGGAVNTHQISSFHCHCSRDGTWTITGG